ncbi:NAD-dependent epimerase/dehydratase family protein [Desulforamulus hydrothermalis]|uniref:NAD-dependent epimerase/dehydratase family protein n=1 Tax=Desulforamulus hydrothermalis TaxID=412895 RepID=UPI001EE481B2|nr:NAD(P)-dependent oxidoreductase [Desulforamulus hydrothermalis]
MTRLKAEEVEILGLVRRRKNVRLINTDATFVTADILDYPTLSQQIRHFQPEMVFHLAAVRPTGRSWSAIQQAYQTNLLGTMNLLRSLQDTGCRAVVLLGSAAEYGRGATPYRELDRLRPVSAYGAAKAAATMLAGLCWEYFKLPVVVLRPTLVYGPAQGEHLFLSQLMRSLLYKRPFAMTAGQQYRDFVYVADVVEALWRAANTPRAAGGVFNIGSGQSVSLRDVAETVGALTGGTDLLRYGAKPYAAEEQFAYCVDIKLARQILQWQPATSLEQGLTTTLQWYRQILNKN